MSLPAVLGLVALVGAVLAVVSLLVLRSSGASVAIARRLAGPPEHRVGDLLDADPLPEHPVRVTGRIRCRDPLEMGDGEKLVAFHRDVDVRIGGRWRSVERLRETRSFDLWDHDGSTPVDPAEAAEPLVAIPQVWRGDPRSLEEPHASAAARLVERHGTATEARAITRTVNVTDRLLVLARPTRDGSSLRLRPPDGGFVISTLALDDAMRLLGGRHRRRAAIAVVGLAIGIALAAVAGLGAVVALLLG